MPHAETAFLSPWVKLRSATFHPFIYQRMVGEADPAARPGDVVQVYDKTNQLFGRGLYNPRSQIALRMLTLGDTPVDAGFWQQRLAQAVELRRTLRIADVTDAYRLVHAEGDGLSGLIVERYADCLVIELFSLGIYQRRHELAAALAAVLDPPASLDRPQRASPVWQVLVRADAQTEAHEGFRCPPQWLHAQTPDRPAAGRDGPTTVVIREHGVRYRVDMASGHKTGFFCDQRDNRRRFAALCRDATVLDVCCYTAGFGLCAKVLGAAREVTSVDLDEAALAIAREIVNLNQTRIDRVNADAFPYLRQMIANHRQYDCVLLDPPKLALSRADLEEALGKYHDLNVLGVRVLKPGGILLTCSCSGLVSRETFLETVHRAARRAGRTLQMFDQTGAGADHPVLLKCPESAYLKALWFRVL